MTPLHSQNELILALQLKCYEKRHWLRRPRAEKGLGEGGSERPAH